MHSPAHMQKASDSGYSPGRKWPVIQTDLEVGKPGDKYEKEADAVSNSVMMQPSMSEEETSVMETAIDEEEMIQLKTTGEEEILQMHIAEKAEGRLQMSSSVQMKCEYCEREEAIRRKPAIRRSGDGIQTVTPDLARRIHSAMGGGRPLESGIQREMESKIGADFSSVNIHTGPASVQMNRELGAKAFTVGKDIHFNRGQYDPDSSKGKRLLAHELTHVVQQTRVHNSIDSVPLIQRQEHVDELENRNEDPNFLLCMALCYLGVPTPVWKRAVELFMQAVWEEYKDRYPDRNRALAEFRSFQVAVRSYGALNILKLVLTFVVEGKIGSVPVRSTAAQALRRRLRNFLTARGVTAGKLAAGLHIVRKATLVIEVAWTAGCGAYCGSMSYAQNIIKMTDALAEGVIAGAKVVEAVGEVIHGGLEVMFVRPVFVARATLDPLNWDISALPARAVSDIKALGFYLWAVMEPEDPDTFMANTSRRLDTFSIPTELISDIAHEIEIVMNTRSIFQLSLPPEKVWQFSVFGFVQFLQDWGVLRFHREPQQVADEALYGDDVIERQVPR